MFTAPRGTEPHTTEPHTTEPQQSARTAAGLSRRAALGLLGAAPVLLWAGDRAAADDTPTRSRLSEVFAAGKVTAPTLSVDASSPQSNIKAVQYLLTAWGVSTGADGSYGPKTNASIKTYQSKHKLAVDGSAGPKTMASLTSTTGYPGSPNANTTKAVQQLLVKNGYKVKVDGSYASGTTTAVKNWQAKIGIEKTGKVDATTWAFLFSPPPPPAPGTWTKEFMVQREDYSGQSGTTVNTIQRQNLQFIIAVGKGHKVPARGIQIAMATVMVESWIYNRYVITDGTSGGLFQQQTSTGWGTSSQVRNKLLATKAFFGIASHTSNRGLADFYPNYLDWSIGAAAQKVQGSKYPTRYNDRAPDAVSLYKSLEAGVKPYTG